MPYVPDLSPPPQWFAGRVFLIEAKRHVDELNKDVTRFSFFSYVRCKWMFMRGIRTVLELVPHRNRIGLNDHCDDVVSVLDDELLAKAVLDTFMGISHQYSYYFRNCHFIEPN